MANLEINMSDDLHERLRRVTGDYGAVQPTRKCIMSSPPKKTDGKQIRSLVDSTAPRAASPKAWPPGRPPGGEIPTLLPEAKSPQEKS